MISISTQTVIKAANSRLRSIKNDIEQQKEELIRSTLEDNANSFLVKHRLRKPLTREQAIYKLKCSDGRLVSPWQMTYLFKGECIDQMINLKNVAMLAEQEGYLTIQLSLTHAALIAKIIQDTIPDPL